MKDTCKNGHPLTEAMVYVTRKGVRDCKECRRLSAYRSRKRRGLSPGEPQTLDDEWNGRRIRGVDDRFWSKVDKASENECWEWRGTVHARGYGQFYMHGSIRGAHQAVLEIVGKPRPGPEFHACHTCDNPICVNPNHLWWGTASENMRDSIRKGRKGRLIMEKYHAGAL